jgi:hypothetical protein
METCFVIQPFDSGRYDKRYADTFKPAIEASGLTPYRVDQDPSVTIPIERIEEGIRNSSLCFAEISTNNPNVWYELGYAFASGKDVVMVCCESERAGRFPFDIQHKHVLRYNNESASNFKELEKNITIKIRALLEKNENIKKVMTTPLREEEGLTQHEQTLLFILMADQIVDEAGVSVFYLRDAFEKAGFTQAAFSLTTRLLKKKALIKFENAEQYNGESYYVCRLTELGE